MIPHCFDLFNFLRGRDTASPHMRTVGNNATSMASRIKLSSIVSVAATATVYAAFASLAAQGVALVSSLGPLVGLLAALPSLLFAAVPGVAALLIGFAGLGAALKRTAGGAGQSAQAIAAAEHRIEMAQRAATQAQEDLNDARKTAADRLADITRELARAHLDEEGALLAVADAWDAMREAQISGDPSAVAHANLGYREAIQSLAEVQARLTDVTEEEQKRREAGVEGSDEVQTALQRQADATRDLAEAQKALSEGGGGGGVDKAAEAYAKLTDEGRALVDVLRGLAPAWTDLRASVQSSLFAGVAEDVQALADGWLPMLKRRLSEVATGWNIAFRQTAQLAATPGFIDDMNDALGDTATFWQSVGKSFAPFFSGFRHFTVVGARYLPQIGAWIEGIAKRFDAWAEAARRTGKANEWIEKGAEVAGQLWEILKNLGASIIAVFRAGSGGPDWLPGLVEGTRKLREWLESPAGQGALAEVFTTLRNIGSELWGVAKELGPAILAIFQDGTAENLASDFADVLGFVADHLEDIKDWLPAIAAGYVLYRAAIIPALVIEGIRLPILAATAVANWRLATALNANTAATGAQTTANYALGVSTFAALGIIGLFLIAIALMAAEIWFMAKNFDNAMLFVRKSWDWWWDQIIGRAQGAVDWIVEKVGGLIDWFRNLRIDVPGLWDGIVWAFKSAINQIIYGWNRLQFTIGGGSFLGFSIPSATFSTPDIPYLDTGGRVTSDGLAFIHKGEDVVPVAQVQRGGGGAQTVRVVFDVTGADAEFKRLIRKMVRGDGGGSVQIAFGRS